MNIARGAIPRHRRPALALLALACTIGLAACTSGGNVAPSSQSPNGGTASSSSPTTTSITPSASTATAPADPVAALKALPLPEADGREAAKVGLDRLDSGPYSASFTAPAGTTMTASAACSRDVSTLKISYSYKDGKETIEKGFWEACGDGFGSSGGLASPAGGGLVTMKVEAPKDVAVRLVVLLTPDSAADSANVKKTLSTRTITGSESFTVEATQGRYLSFSGVCSGTKGTVSVHTTGTGPTESLPHANLGGCPKDSTMHVWTEEPLATTHVRFEVSMPKGHRLKLTIRESTAPLKTGS